MGCKPKEAGKGPEDLKGTGILAGRQSLAEPTLYGDLDSPFISVFGSGATLGGDQELPLALYKGFTPDKATMRD